MMKHFSFLPLFAALACAPLCGDENQPAPPSAEIKTQATYCYFIPPKGWEFANPEKRPGHVHIQFLGKNTKGFTPSINLASEPAQLSMHEYLKTVKKIHESDRTNSWRDLGKIKTQSGEAYLTEIESRNTSGAVRILQLLLLKDRTVYILTASALKEEFAAFYKDFERAFKSLTVTHDLIGAVPQAERQGKLRAALAAATSTNLKSLEKLLLSEFSDMGPHWQLLLIQSALNLQ